VAFSTLSMPVDIPWASIATSPDMMDVTFCDESFPFDWRSSLAISVFEPKPEDLPDQFCGGRLVERSLFKHSFILSLKEVNALRLVIRRRAIILSMATAMVSQGCTDPTKFQPPPPRYTLASEVTCAEWHWLDHPLRHGLH
jgi:hypothetical protein